MSAAKRQPEPAVEIRHCHTLAEFKECEAIERQTWGEDLLVPVPLFVVAAHTGGQVLGAFADSRMAGFTLAFAGNRDGVFLHSHMAAVLPEFRDRGIGRRLKLVQREDALDRGIERIEWTFDPLEVKNAHLNLNKLGAIARRLIPNCYGVTESPLHHGLPTDRLVAEWWIASERVRAILAGANVAGGAAVRESSRDVQRVPLPKDWERLRTENRDVAASAQAQVRENLETLFAVGYAVMGVDTRGRAAEYLLEKADDIEGLKLPEKANQ